MHDNPIIIIGAGRSGTSTLISLLDASPDIYMASEASFFVPKLWQAIYEIPSKSILIKKGIEEREGFEGISLPELIERQHELHAQFDEALKGERKKSLEFAREISFRILGCDTRSFKRWGFKEIWNGHPRTNHGWAIYNEIFDKAQWIHCIRHPFDFVKSIASPDIS